MHPSYPQPGSPAPCFGSLAAVLCDGMPLAIEVFEGNTLDPKTVSSQIQKIATRFGYITAITKP